MLPDITIVMTTYFPDTLMGLKRVQAATDTLISWRDCMKYDGAICLHIADDGSELGNYDPESIWDRGLVTYSRQQRQGVGSSLNKGFQKAHERSPLVLYAVDDWSLTHDFDLTNWAKVLLEYEYVGMVRLGPPHPNLTGRIMHLGDLGWGLLFDRYSFTYGQRPALYHKRFTDDYGWFPEQCSALECERQYSENVNSTQKGSEIMMALPCVWDHIYTISMSDIHPES